MLKSKFFRNCLALLLITLVAGLALALVNEVTKAPIEAAENQVRLDAYSVAFDGAEFVDENDIAKASELELACDIDDILSAKDENGSTIGYVMSVTSHSGYGGDIQIAVGISARTDTITGFTVLSHSETAGLGARCSEEEFQNQFKGKTAQSDIEYIKGGGASSDTEIDAISGATITTAAVTDAVNAAVEFYNYIKE